MNHKDRLGLLNKWYERSLAWELAYEDFRKLLGVDDCEKCPILAAGWAVHDAYTTAVSDQAGDDYGWLDWWYYDTRKGARKGLAPEVRGKKRRYRTVADLCRIIEADLTEGQKT